MNVGIVPLRSPPSGGIYLHLVRYEFKPHLAMRLLGEIRMQAQEGWNVPTHNIEEDHALVVYFEENHNIEIWNVVRMVPQGEDALSWYESFGWCTSWEFLYAAPSHLRRGQIYDRLGVSEKAKEHSSRFIEMWGDCDPQFTPALEMAQQRLADLNQR